MALTFERERVREREREILPLPGQTVARRCLQGIGSLLTLLRLFRHDIRSLLACSKTRILKSTLYRDLLLKMY